MNHIPQIAPTFRFQWEEVQDCYVILYPEGMVKLSGSAGEIMKRCDGEKNIDDIIAELKTAFPGVELEDDVHNFRKCEEQWLDQIQILARILHQRMR